MYSDIPFWLSLVLMLGGLAVLAWSSDVFVDGAAAVAKALGISPFIIGMVIIGFGTSAPELCVSTMSGLSGHANLSLGNAYGSNIFNIAMILGIAVLIFPLVPGPNGEPAFSHYILTRDIPLMTVLSLSILFFGINWKHPKWPGAIQRKEAWIWIVTFVGYTLLMFYQETN